MKSREEKLKIIEPYIKDVLSYDKFMRTRDINHHWEFSIFDHCLDVAYSSFVITKFLKLDYVSTVRAGIMHDFFLYNWKKEQPKEGLHGFVHAQIAYNNAMEHFELNDKEQDIILRHMFPLNIKPPKYIESLIVCLVDKVCAMNEVLEYVYLVMKCMLMGNKKKLIIPDFVYSFLYIFLITKVNVAMLLLNK